MNRRSFFAAAAAALVLRKLPLEPAPLELGAIYPSRPFGMFQVPDEPFATSWHNTATGELAMLDDLNRRLPRTYDMGWRIGQETLDDDAFGFGRT